MDTDRLYIVIPAYNEEENIRQIVDDWYPIVEKHNGGGESRLVIIDDGSKDRTYAILTECAGERPLLQPLTKPNAGHGATVLYGYHFALDHGADYVFQTDSDGQTDVSEFEGFWAVRDKYDAVVGERLQRGDGAARKFVEDVVCFLLKVVFGVSAKDANAPFRLMNAEVLKKYIDRLPKDFNIPNIMLTTYFLYYKEKICFKQISFKPRHAGKASINAVKIMRIGAKAIKDFYVLKKDM